MRMGKVKKKILLLFLAGLSMSLTRSPKQHWRVVKSLKKEWAMIDKRSLEDAIANLYKSNLIEQKRNKDGTTSFILSREGKRVALTYKLDEMNIEKHLWDKRWRIVIFDIPERLKKVREAFRYHLKRMGFKELQHSVFILPFRCRDEIEYLVEFYLAKRYVRFIEADYVDNELDLKRHFKLIN